MPLNQERAKLAREGDVDLRKRTRETRRQAGVAGEGFRVSGCGRRCGRLRIARRNRSCQRKRSEGLRGWRREFQEELPNQTVVAGIGPGARTKGTRMRSRMC